MEGYNEKKAVSKDIKEKSTPAKDVDEYLITVPEKERVALEYLRKAIKDAAPMAEEIISYRIPTYNYHGSLVHFAAFKNHSSLLW